VVLCQMSLLLSRYCWLGSELKALTLEAEKNQILVSETVCVILRDSCA
jgi:hypothetical protein